MLKKEYRFYKTENDEWYIDLPQYIEAGGKQTDLQMVAGADHLLEILSNFTNEVYLYLDTTYFAGSFGLDRVDCDEIENGSIYETVNHPQFGNMQFWLCDVTKYIFGNFPNTIYFTVKK